MDAERTIREIDRILADAAAQIHALLESGAGGVSKPSPSAADRLITAEEVAQILGIDVRWVSQNGPTLPFRVVLTPRKMRYSLKGLHVWLSNRPR